MVNQLLATYGMPLNRKLTVSLKPADKGVFDVVLDGQLIFSKHQQGRFPTMEDWQFLTKVSPVYYTRFASSN
jgi:selT/selW/selH-like putative selenoprotein